MDRIEVRKISVKALRYVLIDGILYKKYVLLYLKCLRAPEAETALREVRDEIYG